MIKKMLTEEPALANYAKDKDNIVSTDASKTGLGITLWQKQADGELKPIAFGSRFLNDSEKNYSIGELELLAVVWGLEKFRFYLYGKKVFLYTDHQALEPLIKRNRCNKQYSARLTRWLDRLAHFDISIQHIAGSNLKFTDYLSRNPVEGATTENIYDEQYVINTLTEQAELNLKYGRVFTNQLQRAPNTKITHDCKLSGQSGTNRTFEKNRHVNKTNEQTLTSPNSDAIELKRQEALPLHNHLKSATASIGEEIDRDYFHRGATAEIMQIIQRREKLKYQLPKNESGNLKTLTEPGQEIQINFTGKLHNKKLNGENQLLIAVDRFSKWPTVKICKTSETKEVINFLKQNFNLYGIPEKIKSDKGGAFISKDYIEFCKSKNIEIEYCTPRIHTGTGAVERAIQTMKNLIVANLEDNLCLTECVNRALKVMRFTIHTGLKLTPFELQHGRKPRTELTNLVKDGKSFLSDWTELSVSAERKPKIPIYVSKDVTNYLVMAKTKAEEKAVDKQPKKKNSVSEYPFKFVEKKLQ